MPWGRKIKRLNTAGIIQVFLMMVALKQKVQYTERREDNLCQIKTVPTGITVRYADNISLMKDF